jgi:SNF2 family DNA or RNA helicase
VLEAFERGSGAGFFGDPGVGKTLTSLEIIRRGGFKKVLVISPLRVTYSVWPAELEKWKPFPVDYNIAHGPKKSIGDHHIDLINRDAMKWLSEQDTPDYDLVIIDELTSFKNWTSQRTKCLKKFLARLPKAKRLGLTGTPCPNSYAELFPQMYLLDKGKSLGKVITKFRNTYCYRGGFKGKEWLFREDRKALLEATVAESTLRVDALDHLDLPPIDYPVHRCRVSGESERIYRDVERNLVALLSDDDSIYVGSASAAYGACKQIANGRVYGNPEDQFEESREVTTVHTAKVEYLAELLDELNGKPAIIAYHFRHDLDALRTIPALKKAPAINGQCSGADAAKILDGWNSRRYNHVLVHPASVSHGVNMQAGGNDLIWFGLTDRLEDYLQLNRRLWRQGVKGQVRIHHLITEDTVEEVILQRLLDKDDNQTTFLERLKEYGTRLEYSD